MNWFKKGEGEGGHNEREGKRGEVGRMGNHYVFICSDKKVTN